MATDAKRLLMNYFRKLILIKEKKLMNILIIGASSFIGAYQVEQLINTPDFVGSERGEILDLGIIMKVSVCLIIILMYVIMILLRF